MIFLLRRLSLVLLTVLISPLLAVLALTLLFFNLAHQITRFTRKPLPLRAGPVSGLASIVILNWNGRELLAEGIPSVLEAVRADGRDHEVIVVDNGSSDGSIEFLRQEFPRVRIVRLDENLGFAEGNNAGVRAARHDIVVLLNNDMVVDRAFLRPLLEGFGPRTFAVSSQIHHQDPDARREETGKTSAVFRRGMIDFSHSDLDGRSLQRTYYPTLWAGGGSSAFHRERFLLLGGFHEIYSPAYVEDTDLSYMAWRAGWEVLFAPGSVVHHKHRASSSRRFSPEQLERLILRNQLFFLWKNIRSWPLLFSHCLFLPWTCYRLARDSGLAIWRAILSGAGGLVSVEIAKLGTPFRGRRSDAEIFGMFANPAQFFYDRRYTADESSGAPDQDSQKSSVGPASNSKPRLLWVTAYLPHIGRHAGAGRMFHLLRRLAPDYEVTLLSFLEKEEEREFISDLEPLCRKVVALRRSPPRRWQLFAYEPFEEFRTPGMEKAVRECLEDHDFDLVQLEYTQMASYAPGIPGLPTLLTKHEVDFAACARRMRTESRPWSKFRWLYNYFQVLEREVRLLRRVSGAICMTEPDAREMNKFCRTVPIHVINTGVDLEYFKPHREPATDPRLVFVGFFQHLPNVDAMIYFCHDVLPRIRVKMPGTELRIVGSHPPPAIENLARIPDVTVTGYVEDVRPHMAASSVYVVPVRLGVGIRGKILEAWGMGMAVVATSVACSGLNYVRGENLLVADDAELFAAHVVSLLKDPSRRARMGVAGRRTAEEHYGWNAAARRLDALYRHYLGLPEVSDIPVAERGRA